jgi:hypothetical protein
MLITAVTAVVASMVLWLIEGIPSAISDLDMAATFDTAPIVAALLPAAQLLPMDALKWVLGAAAGLFATDWVITGWSWLRGFGGR